MKAYLARAASDMSNIKIEMKFKLTLSSVLLAAIALGACGGADESRTRNATLSECRAPGTGPSSEAFLAKLLNELDELRRVHQQKIEVVDTARQVLAQAKNNVPEDLKFAVARFHAYQNLIEVVQRQINALPTSGLRGKDLEIATKTYQGNLEKYEKNKNQEGMNALLVKRAAQLKELVDAHTKAVEEADEAHAVYQYKEAARDEVVAFASLPECVSVPVLSAGDAEAMVKQVAENVPTTSTTERPMFQFYDQPSSNLAGLSDVGGRSVVPPETVETRIGQEITSTTSTTSIPSYIYEPPTSEQILKAAIEDVDAAPTTSTTSTSLPTETQVVVDELQTLIDRVVDDLQSSPTRDSDEQEQTATQEQAAEKVVAVGTASESLTESATDVNKTPVKVVAAGFAPNSAVVVSAADGSPLATATTSDSGIVDIEVMMPTSETRSERSLVIAGTNQEGKKIAVPIVVDTEVVTTTTEPTSTTETADSSSWSSIRIVLLAFLLLLFLAWLVQTRRKKSA
jgi:hypothetical protein